MWRGPAPLLTWPLIGALLLHPAVIAGAVSIAGQNHRGSGDADAGLSILVIPDPAARQVGGPAGLGQLAHRGRRQRRVTLCQHVCGVPGRDTLARHALVLVPDLIPPVWLTCCLVSPPSWGRCELSAPLCVLVSETPAHSVWPAGLVLAARGGHRDAGCDGQFFLVSPGADLLAAADADAPLVNVGAAPSLQQEGEGACERRQSLQENPKRNPHTHRSSAGCYIQRPTPSTDQSSSDMTSSSISTRKQISFVSQ